MKPIHKDEIYEHISKFLAARGIELKDGSYARGIQAGCGFLTDAINMSQEGVQRARTEVNKNLDRMRQFVHDQTAPKPPPIRPTAEAKTAAEAGPAPEPGPAPKTARKATTSKKKTPPKKQS